MTCNKEREISDKILAKNSSSVLRFADELIVNKM